MKQQHTLMKICPAFGTEKPWPSHAQQWRDYHGQMAWLFNPWTGNRRHPADIGSDPLGWLILPPDERVYAAQNANRINAEALKLANAWETRARKKFADAAHEECPTGKRFIEHGAVCYANAALEIRDAFGLTPNAQGEPGATKDD
jgi:hypothetical protein